MLLLYEQNNRGFSQFDMDDLLQDFDISNANALEIP